MKHLSTRITALVLALVLVCSLAACSKPNPAGDNGSSGNGSFSRGTVSGSTYTNKYLGLSFHAPSNWYYYSDDQIASLMNTTASYMSDPAAFEAATDGEVIDFFCSNSDGSCNVDLSFTKSSSFSSVDASVKTTVDYMKSQYEYLGLTVTVSSPVDRTLCGRNYRMAEFSVDGIMTQYFYMTLVDNYLVCITGTFCDGTTSAEFEAMFY